MTVYVDRGQRSFRYMTMSHMVADTLEELHTMAEKIGMKREWFQPKSFPHYDVSQTKRKLALAAGAQEIGRKELVEFMQANRDRLTLELQKDKG